MVFNPTRIPVAEVIEDIIAALCESRMRPNWAAVGRLTWH
jgi:hypothetical protein